MKRGYVAEAVAEAAERLAAAVPGIAITGDVIAGFPGETEAEHRETAQLLTRLPLAGLHVFPFSARKGTPAASMPGQVALAVRRERAAELRRIAASKREDFLRRLINGRLDVIVTSKKPDAQGLVAAVGDIGVEVLLPEGGCGYGELGAAMITRVQGSEVHGVWA
jgi:threonylcarbamoyladenosine tRNA methylthiotransferase MtaB